MEVRGLVRLSGSGNGSWGGDWGPGVLPPPAHLSRLMTLWPGALLAAAAALGLWCASNGGRVGGSRALRPVERLSYGDL